MNYKIYLSVKLFIYFYFSKKHTLYIYNVIVIQNMNVHILSKMYHYSNTNRHRKVAFLMNKLLLYNHIL